MTATTAATAPSIAFAPALALVSASSSSSSPSSCVSPVMVVVACSHFVALLYKMTLPLFQLADNDDDRTFAKSI